MYRFSFKQYMRISPDSPRKATHITFGKIHSTDKSNTSVNHHNLPVIAIIHFTREQGKTDLQKTAYLNSCISHLFEKAMRNMPTSYIVIDHTHLDSLPRFLDQYITYQSSHRIILKDVIFHMNMKPRLLQLSQQSL